MGVVHFSHLSSAFARNTCFKIAPISVPRNGAFRFVNASFRFSFVAAGIASVVPLWQRCYVLYVAHGGHSPPCNHATHGGLAAPCSHVTHGGHSAHCHVGGVEFPSDCIFYWPLLVRRRATNDTDLACDYPVSSFLACQTCQET